jgi:hypothetical protein
MNKQTKINTSTTRIPRSKDPAFMLNPKTRRYIKRGGKIHQQMVNDNLYNLDPNKRGKEHSLIAEGTNSEVRMVRDKLVKSGAIDLTNQVLRVRDGKLYKTRRKLLRHETADHITHHTVSTLVANRSLAKTNLSNDQLTQILLRCCDAKLIGKSFDVETEAMLLMSLNDREEKVTTPPPPSPKKKTIKKTRRRRFVVKPAPITETDVYSTDDEYDSELSE